MRNDCLFCAIADGEIPAFKLYEDEMYIAYLDINPFSYGHTLVIPKAHYENLDSIDENALKDLIVRVKKIASHISSVLSAKGYNILQNNGEAAGQTVKHIHFHIIPRFEGDKIAFENTPGDMEKLKALAERLKM